MVMAWITSAGWFLVFAGVISIFDFAMRPAVPSIMRLVYPEHHRSHSPGPCGNGPRSYSWALRFYPSALLSAASTSARVFLTIRVEIALASLACVTAFCCFRQLPDHGDGSDTEASPRRYRRWRFRQRKLLPRGWTAAIRHYLAVFFLFAFGNLFYQGVVPAFFARDMGLGYVQATLFTTSFPI